jgi:hypothetical protein
LHLGRRFDAAAAEEERGGAPSTLIELLARIGGGLPLPDAIQRLAAWGQDTGRPASEREARAAILVACALEWLRAE